MKKFLTIVVVGAALLVLSRSAFSRVEAAELEAQRLGTDAAHLRETFLGQAGMRSGTDKAYQVPWSTPEVTTDKDYVIVTEDGQPFDDSVRIRVRNFDDYSMVIINVEGATRQGSGPSFHHRHAVGTDQWGNADYVWNPAATPNVAADIAYITAEGQRDGNPVTVSAPKPLRLARATTFQLPPGNDDYKGTVYYLDTLFLPQAAVDLGLDIEEVAYIAAKAAERSFEFQVQDPDNDFDPPPDDHQPDVPDDRDGLWAKHFEIGLYDIDQPVDHITPSLPRICNRASGASYANLGTRNAHICILTNQDDAGRNDKMKNLKPAPYPNGVQTLVAHEFFHNVQRAYLPEAQRWSGEWQGKWKWFYEGQAAFIPSVQYEASGIYFDDPNRTLPRVIKIYLEDNLNTSLSAISFGGYPYVLYWRYLYDQRGMATIEQTLDWARTRPLDDPVVNGSELMDAALGGTNKFAESINDFAAANYALCFKLRPEGNKYSHYEGNAQGENDQPVYVAPKITHVITCTDDLGRLIDTRLIAQDYITASFGMDFIEFVLDDKKCKLAELEFFGQDPKAQFSVQYWYGYKTGQGWVTSIAAEPKPVKPLMPDGSEEDRVILAPMERVTTTLVVPRNSDLPNLDANLVGVIVTRLDNQEATSQAAHEANTDGYYTLMLNFDSDNDWIPSGLERYCSPFGTDVLGDPPCDTDHDDIPDYLDIDSDTHQDDYPKCVGSAEGDGNEENKPDCVPDMMERWDYEAEPAPDGMPAFRDPDETYVYYKAPLGSCRWERYGSVGTWGYFKGVECGIQMIREALLKADPELDPGDPPMPGMLFSTTPLESLPPADAHVLTAFPTHATGPLSASLVVSHAMLSGLLSASWTTDAWVGAQFTGLTVTQAQVYDENDVLIATGAVHASPPAPVEEVGEGPALAFALAMGDSLTYTVEGQGSASFYAPAADGLGVGGNWLTYMARMQSNGLYGIGLQGAVVSVDGQDYTGTLVLVTSEPITLTGFGHTLAPTFAGRAVMQAQDARLIVGQAAGTAAISGTALNAGNGRRCWTTLAL